MRRKIVGRDYSELTAEQQANFAAELSKVGMTPDQVPARIVTSEAMTLHSVMSMSSIPGKTIAIRDLAHLKELGGVPDSQFDQSRSDSHIDYPAPLEGSRAKLLSAQSAESLADSLAPEE